MKNKKPFLILIVCAFGAFLATFNETFLNIAFTPIMKDFNVSVSTVQWLTTAYMLGAAIMVPISSFLYQKFKTKPLFLFTVGLLITGSVIGSVSPNFEILLTGRIIQSIGTGMLIPIGMNLTLSIVPREKIGTYLGVMGAATTLGPSLSIISAGVLLALGNWHILFYLFTTFTIILFILGLVFLGKTNIKEKPKLDILSVILISLSLIGLLYGISILFSGNLIIAITSVVVGGFLLMLFVKRENKINNPLVNFKPLKIKEFRIGMILNMCALTLVFAMNIIMPLYIQNALGMPAFGASLTLFPAVILTCILSPIAGKLYDKYGIKHILSIGFFLMFIFLILLALARQTHSLLLIGLLYIPVNSSAAFIIGPAQSFALSHLNNELNPHGVTLLSTGFQIAGCIGSSVFTGVYSLALTTRISQGFDSNDSLFFAYLITLIVAIILVLIAFVLTFKARKFEKEKAKTINLTLEAIMKKNVYTVNENDNLLNVIKFITDNNVSGVPVVNNNNQLVGFISDGDIMRYLSKVHPLFTNVYYFMVDINNTFDDKLKNLMNAKVYDIVKKKVITIDIILVLKMCATY